MMKYEIVNIAQQYRDENIDATDAMDTIVRILFPEKLEESYEYYTRRLIAFMWGLDPDEIINHEMGRSGDLTALKGKVMWTKILSYIKNDRGAYISLTQLKTKLGLSTHAGVKYRLDQHDNFMEFDEDYKHIYNIISKIL